MSVLAGVLILAVGTYGIRLAGALVPEALVTPRVERAIALGTAALLGAVVATSTVFEGGDFAGWARVAGVVVGTGAALLRAPLLLVIASALVTTACLRLVGVA